MSKKLKRVRNYVKVKMTDCNVSNTTIAVAGDQVTQVKSKSHEMDYDSGCNSSEGIFSKAKNLFKFETHHITLFMAQNECKEVHVNYGNGNVKKCVIYDPRKRENAPPPTGPPVTYNGKKYRLVQLQVFFTSGIRSRIEIKRDSDRHTHMFVEKSQSVLLNYNGLEGIIPHEIDSTTRFTSGRHKIRIRGKLMVEELWDETYKEDARFYSEGFNLKDRDTLCRNLPPAVKLFDY